MSSSGLRLVPLPGVPVVAVRAWLPGGVRAEDHPGLALLTGRALNEGTESRDWRVLAREMEDRGAMVHAGAGMAGHGVGIEALAGDADRALEWVAEMVREPTFPEERLDWIKLQALAELESLRDAPEAVAGWAFAEQLYHPHPAGRPPQGDPESIKALDAGACRRFHRAALQRGAVVVVAGDLEAAGGEERLGARLEALFGGLGAPAAQAAPAPFAEPRGLPGRRRTVDLPAGAEGVPGAEQAHLYLGHRTLPRTHRDFPALELAAIVLGAGSGLTGRIPFRVREQEGLAYQAGADLVAGAGHEAGRLAIYVGTARKQAELAETAVRQELTRLLEEGLKDDEVDDARAYLVGREAFRRETARQRADLAVESAAYGLPVDRDGWREERWRALDRAAVEAALRRHLRPGKLRVTVGLPAA